MGHWTGLEGRSPLRLGLSLGLYITALKLRLGLGGKGLGLWTGNVCKTYRLGLELGLELGLGLGLGLGLDTWLNLIFKYTIASSHDVLQGLRRWRSVTGLMTRVWMRSVTLYLLFYWCSYASKPVPVHPLLNAKGIWVFSYVHIIGISPKRRVERNGKRHRGPRGWLGFLLTFLVLNILPLSRWPQPFRRSLMFVFKCNSKSLNNILFLHSHIFVASLPSPHNHQATDILTKSGVWVRGWEHNNFQATQVSNMLYRYW